MKHLHSTGKPFSIGNFKKKTSGVMSAAQLYLTFGS